MEMLELNNLHKTFNPGTVNEKVALNGVSLQMEAGDFATIVGSNGAGKSTLFNAITGGFIADEGSILLGGQDITFAPEHQRSKVIGHLFQDPLKGTAPNMTIEENLSLAAASGGWLSHVTRAEKASFREKLAQLDMGLEDRMKQPVGLLSGGQRQRAALVRTLQTGKPLLLLDEPFGALDAITRLHLQALLTEIATKKRLTILFVTHDVDEALLLSDAILVMGTAPGRILRQYTLEEPRPRTMRVLSQPEFIRVKGEILTLLDKEVTADA